MRIPSQKQCHHLILEMEMMAHIVDHSCQVCNVAVFLADHLIKNGLHLNRELIRAAAILHDITKTRSFETGEDHARTGGQLLIEMGYPEVGNIIRQHVALDNSVNSGEPDETDIVNYADKRVRHDRIVSLDQRMAYILERYGKSPEHCLRIQKLWRETIRLEKKIFTDLPFQPGDCCKDDRIHDFALKRIQS
ncbi:MAG: HDIG domain-containing protein [Desulfobacterales bacterium]|nr:HDIG domain-containing protein [Desulfobacterales bacterium]